MTDNEINLVFQLLDEYDIGIWENIYYIPLADAWVKVMDANRYEHGMDVKELYAKRKRELKQFMEEYNGKENETD